MDPPFYKIPKVVSGLDDIVPGSLVNILKIYSAVVETLVPVSCVEVAEMLKLYENGQRMIGVAYANEMADAARLRNLNPFEIVGASATKNFGFLSFDLVWVSEATVSRPTHDIFFRITSAHFWSMLQRQCLNVRLPLSGQSRATCIEVPQKQQSMQSFL